MAGDNMLGKFKKIGSVGRSLLLRETGKALDKTAPRSGDKKNSLFSESNNQIWTQIQWGVQKYQTAVQAWGEFISAPPSEFDRGSI